MTFHGEHHTRIEPAILTAEAQQAVWFLGALVRIQTGADATAGRLAVLDHQAQRGHGSPVHIHRADDETFLVLEGELRVEVDEVTRAAGPGAAAFLPRRLPHAFVVTSPQARWLTIHTPAGFDQFTLAVGTAVEVAGAPSDREMPPDRAAFAAKAATFGIEILGPPPAP